ncbi:MAG: hypothetical protein QXD13_02135 [Candidatus Pacearchaeota archaeon]
MRIGKRGQLGGQLIMIAFVFLMAIVGGGIAIGTALFIGPEFDMRQIEADMLNAKIRACINENAFDINNLKLDDIYSTCGLNKNVVESYYLIKICVRKGVVENCISEQNPIASTGGDFVVCGMAEKNEKFPKCAISAVSARGTNLAIITVSNQKLRRGQ